MGQLARGEKTSCQNYPQVRLPSPADGQPATGAQVTQPSPAEVLPGAGGGCPRMPFSEPSVLGVPALVLADEPIPPLVEGQEGFPRPLPLLARQQAQQPLLGREAKQEVAWRVQETPPHQSPCFCRDGGALPTSLGEGQTPSLHLHKASPHPQLSPRIGTSLFLSAWELSCSGIEVCVCVCFLPSLQPLWERPPPPPVCAFSAGAAGIHGRGSPSR